MSVLVFVSHDFELGRKLRCDLRQTFSSDLRLARRRSRPSVPNGLILLPGLFTRFCDSKLLLLTMTMTASQ